MINETGIGPSISNYMSEIDRTSQKQSVQTKTANTIEKVSDVGANVSAADTVQLSGMKIVNKSQNGSEAYNNMKDPNESISQSYRQGSPESQIDIKGRLANSTPPPKPESQTRSIDDTIEFLISDKGSMK